MTALHICATAKATAKKKETEKPSTPPVVQHVLRAHRTRSYVDSDEDDFVLPVAKKMRVRTRKTVVTLSTICYITDDSEELTDWDDFEF